LLQLQPSVVPENRFRISTVVRYSSFRPRVSKQANLSLHTRTPVLRAVFMLVYSRRRFHLTWLRRSGSWRRCFNPSKASMAGRL